MAEYTETALPSCAQALLKEALLSRFSSSSVFQYPLLTFSSNILRQHSPTLSSNVSRNIRFNMPPKLFASLQCFAAK